MDGLYSELVLVVGWS